MSNFIKQIKALESDVEQREAQQKAEREQRQQEYEARVRDARVANTIIVAKWLGIEVSPDDLSGFALNVIHVGSWRIQFTTTYQKFEGGNSSEEITNISLTSAKSFAASPREGDDKKYGFGVTFTYLPLILSKWNESHADDYELYHAVIDETQKINEYVAPIKHPLGSFKGSDYFGKDFHIVVPFDEEPQSISEDQRLDMAKSMLAIEKRYDDVEKNLEAWRIAAAETLSRLEVEYQEQERRRIEDAARYERKQKERVEKRRQEQATKPRYTFSGNSLGEILEAVYREIAAENQDQ